MASVQLLESTLGILPGHNEQPPEDAPFTANRVIIAGFLTDGPAIKQQDKLRVGDWIRSIDGHQVRSPPVIIIIMILNHNV